MSRRSGMITSACIVLSIAQLAIAGLAAYKADFALAAYLATTSCYLMLWAVFTVVYMKGDR